MTITEQEMIDRGSIHTREDARILARCSPVARHHYRYSDRKDAHLMALAGAKAELKREVNRIMQTKPAGEER